jgi:sulfur-oxidizing protein SoxX
MRMVSMALAMALLAGPARAAEPVVAYAITDGSEIAESLTGAPGDAARGRALYAEEPWAGCPDCHGMPGAPAGESPAMKTDGPSLAGIGARLSEGALRLWIAAPEALDETTEMPAYYAAGQRSDPDDPLYGGPALTAAEIEDLVAYLAGLR